MHQRFVFQTQALVGRPAHRRNFNTLLKECQDTVLYTNVCRCIGQLLAYLLPKVRSVLHFNAAQARCDVTRPS